MENNLLKSVSRSFYLSLRILPSDMRAPISLGYLLCRAADTIADSDAVPVEARLALLHQLSRMMERFPFDINEGEDFSETLKASLTAPSVPEARLLNGFKDLVSSLGSLSRTD